MENWSQKLITHSVSYRLRQTKGSLEALYLRTQESPFFCRWKHVTFANLQNTWLNGLLDFKPRSSRMWQGNAINDLVCPEFLRWWRHELISQGEYRKNSCTSLPRRQVYKTTNILWHGVGHGSAPNHLCATFRQSAGMGQQGINAALGIALFMQRNLRCDFLRMCGTGLSFSRNREAPYRR